MASEALHSQMNHMHTKPREHINSIRDFRIIPHTHIYYIYTYTNLYVYMISRKCLGSCTEQMVSHKLECRCETNQYKYMRAKGKNPKYLFVMNECGIVVGYLTWFLDACRASQPASRLLLYT